jgi:hypothetical protein
MRPLKEKAAARRKPNTATKERPEKRQRHLFISAAKE